MIHTYNIFTNNIIEEQLKSLLNSSRLISRLIFYTPETITIVN